MEVKSGYSVAELMEILKIDTNMWHEFKNLETGEERLAFVRQHSPLKDEDFLTPSDSSGGKSFLRSAELRREGNKAYQRKDYYLALTLYTKSIASAPQPTNELRQWYDSPESVNSEIETALSVAVANRSAVLFELKKYESCLKDVSFALKMNYPHSLTYKLYIRQLKCFQALERGDEVNHTLQLAMENLSFTDKITDDRKQALKKELESIQLETYKLKSNNKQQTVFECPTYFVPHYGKNKVLSGCSDCVEMKMTTDMGRGLFSTRDIEIGDIIATAKPFVSVLYDQFAYTNCHNCCKRCSSLIPCMHCSMVMFCNEECRYTAWRKYHNLECQLLPVLKHIQLLSICLVTLRMVISAASMFESFSEFYEVTKLFDKFLEEPDDQFPHTVLGKYFDYYQVYKPIEIHASSCSAENLLVLCMYGTFLSLILEKQTNFFTGKPSGEQQNCLSENKLKFFIASLMIRHQRNPRHKVYNVKDDSTESFDLSIVADAIYPLPVNLINHSCNPNVFHHTAYDNQIVIRAVSTIRKGQQIFDSYGPTYASMSLNTRRTILSTHHFMCKCIACTENWPTLQELIKKRDSAMYKCGSCGNGLQLVAQEASLMKVCDKCQHRNILLEVAEKIFILLNKLKNVQDDDTALNDTIQLINLINTHFIEPTYEMYMGREAIIMYYFRKAFNNEY